MIIENPYELFILLLSNVRQGTEPTTQMFQDCSKITQNADAKEALAARVFASQRVVEKLDECFQGHRGRAGEAERAPAGWKDFRETGRVIQRPPRQN